MCTCKGTWASCQNVLPPNPDRGAATPQSHKLTAMLSTTLVGFKVHLRPVPRVPRMLYHDTLYIQTSGGYGYVPNSFTSMSALTLYAATNTHSPYYQGLHRRLGNSEYCLRIVLQIRFLSLGCLGHRLASTLVA